MTSKEFDNQKGRFRIELVEPDDSSTPYWALRDTKTGRMVGSDGGEPEDQVLVRDWQWVQVELNALADQLEVAERERDMYLFDRTAERETDSLRAELDRLKQEVQFHVMRERMLEAELKALSTGLERKPKRE